MQSDKHSKFWIPKDIEEIENNIEIDAIKYISYKTAISNFVSIVTGKNIKVNFNESGETNFAQEKSITISGNINSENVDIYCGIALHEACHIIHTNFDVLKTMWHKIPQDLRKDGEKKNLNSKQIENLVLTLLNYVEDRYIDKWAFNNFEGYREYYRALYDRYWNSDAIGAALRFGMYCETDLESYLFRIINMTNLESNIEALPDFDKICKLINLEKIERLKTTHERLSIAIDVARIVVKNIDNSEYDDPKPNSSEKLNNSSNDKTTENVKSAFSDQLDLTNGKLKKEKISKELCEMIDMVEDSNMTINFSEIEFGGGNHIKFPITVIESLKRKIFNPKISGIFNPGGNVKTEDAISEGIKLGKILGKKLKVRGESRTTITNRLLSGKIDGKLLYTLGFKNKHIFYRKQIEFYKPIHLHISLDASGSMITDSKWTRSVSACVAICKAASLIENIHVVFSVRTTTTSDNALLVIVYDSKKNKIQELRNNLSHIQPGGQTPEGILYDYIMYNMPHTSSDVDCYFLNISDGFPHMTNNKLKYSGEISLKDTSRKIRKMKSFGINVMSYFIGDDGFDLVSENNFRYMYGKDSNFINVSDINQISKTMNDCFLKK